MIELPPVSYRHYTDRSDCWVPRCFGQRTDVPRLREVGVNASMTAENNVWSITNPLDDAGRVAATEVHRLL